MTSNSVLEIESFMNEYTGKHCLLVPSGRIALYLILRTHLKQGDKLLMSPINDDVIFFVVLACGLSPVMAPLSAETGNIDPSAISDEIWKNVAGVMTTNLYGIPERIPEIYPKCKEFDVVLIEDAAHAFGNRADNQVIGSRGDAAAFSFSKHLGHRGGCICLNDDEKIKQVNSLRGQLLKSRHLKQKMDDMIRPAALRIMDRLGIRNSIKKLKERHSPAKKRIRNGWRMPIREELLRKALSEDKIASFDLWLQFDGPDYRTSLNNKECIEILSRLINSECYLKERIDGVKRLQEHPAAAPFVKHESLQPLLRVPLLIKNRDDIVKTLKEYGLKLYYIYYPPLDDYAGQEFTHPSPSPENARWWGEHVLPINPLDANKFFNIVEEKKIIIEPARQ